MYFVDYQAPASFDIITDSDGDSQTGTRHLLNTETSMTLSPIRVDGRVVGVLAPWVHEPRTVPFDVGKYTL
jgi:hypothetical protein